MSRKPIKPLQHGIIDYIFSGVQLALPWYLGMNRNLQRTYWGLGAGFLAVNALTDTPAGITKKISFSNHGKADAGFLAGLGLLTAAPFIRKDKKARIFHLAFLATAVAHYVLTDYEAGDQV